MVDDNETVRCIPEDEVSWHAGPATNSGSISVEVCEFTDPVRQQHTNENAAALIKDILSRYSWGLDRIKDPLSVALRILQSHGVISSPDYWLQAARPGQLAKGEYVYLMIINMAQHIDHGR